MNPFFALVLAILLYAFAGWFIFLCVFGIVLGSVLFVESLGKTIEIRQEIDSVIAEYEDWTRSNDLDRCYSSLPDVEPNCDERLLDTYRYGCDEIGQKFSACDDNRLFNYLMIRNLK